MKSLDLITEAQVQEWIRDLQTLHEQLLIGTLSFSRQDLIPEQDVVELLQVSSRTMRTYRKKRYFHFIKLEGSVFYLRSIFYIDMILLSQRSGRENGS